MSAAPQNNRTPRKNGPLLMGSVMLLTVGLSAVSWQFVTTDTGMPLLYLLMLIQAAPFIISLALRRPTFIGLIMANHLVTYSIAKYNQLGVILGLNYVYPEALYAIKHLLVCEVIIIFTYLVCRSLLNLGVNVSKLKVRQFTLKPMQLYILGAYVVSNPWVMIYLGRFATLNFVVNLFALLILLTSKCPGRSTAQYLLKVGAFLSGLGFFLTTGSLALAGMSAVMWFWVTCLNFSTRDFATICTFILFVILVQPVKGDYRGRSSTRFPDHPVTTLGRMELLGQLLYAKYVDFYPSTFEEEQPEEKKPDKVDSLADTLLGGFGRVGDDSLERVLDWTPSRVPYWGGASYSTIPYLFIPRLLWPDKPQVNFWNKFGRTYGFLSPADTQTSVGVTYLAEAYMNFGLFGMICCAVFFGAMVACLEKAVYYILNGYYLPVYLVFAVPVMIYASDMASILNSILIIGGLVFLMRPKLRQLIRRQDLYSKAI